GNRAFFVGRQTLMIGQVLENGARVDGIEVHLVQRRHPLDCALPVLGGGATIGDAREALLLVAAVTRATLRANELTANRDALVPDFGVSGASGRRRRSLSGSSRATRQNCEHG